MDRLFKGSMRRGTEKMGEEDWMENELESRQGAEHTGQMGAVDKV